MSEDEQSGRWYVLPPIEQACARDRQAQRRALPRVQQRDRLAQFGTIGCRIDQNVEAAAAWQAKVDDVGPAAIALHDWLIVNPRARHAGDEFLFQASVRQAADDVAARRNRQLCAQSPGKAAFDADDGAEARAFFAGGAKGCVVVETAVQASLRIRPDLGKRVRHDSGNTFCGKAGRRRDAPISARRILPQGVAPPDLPFQFEASVGHPLDDDRGCHAARRAHCDQPVALFLTLQFIQHGADQDGTRRADRMAHGDGAAIHIHLVPV